MKKWICVFFKLKNDNSRYSVVASLGNGVIDSCERIEAYLINKYGNDFMGIESYRIYTEE